MIMAITRIRTRLDGTRQQGRTWREYELQPGTEGGREVKRVDQVLVSKPGVSANAVPHYQKLRTRVTHIWGNRKSQPNRSAMERPRPERTSLMIKVPPVPGKYAWQLCALIINTTPSLWNCGVESITSFSLTFVIFSIFHCWNMWTITLCILCSLNIALYQWTLNLIVEVLLWLENRNWKNMYLL